MNTPFSTALPTLVQSTKVYNSFAPLLCFALLCFALLCFALLCFALLCFALLCFAYAALAFALFWWGGTFPYPHLMSSAVVPIMS